MTRGTAVSVVIPTIGRASVHAAVESALHQTVPPMEVIVVVDADCDPDLPDSDSVRIVRTSGGVGPSYAKHLGVESATGDVIALLDDDDLWRPLKLEKQLAAAPPGNEWIVSCRFVYHTEGRKPVTGPRALILPNERIAPYLFERRSPRGYGGLPVPTLMFPRAVAQRVPLSASAGSAHDDPKWLIEVRREFPNLPIIQIPEPLADIMVTPGSVSRAGSDRSNELIDWGRTELAGESKRVRGDYMLTSPVGSAVTACSFRGVARSMVAGVRSGRPGLWAWGTAVKAVLRITWRRARTWPRDSTTVRRHIMERMNEQSLV